MEKRCQTRPESHPFQGAVFSGRVKKQRRNLSDQSLRKVEPMTFALKLVVLSTLLFACVYGITQTGGLTRFFLQICTGALFAHATELVHQCLHKTATGVAPLDHAIGMALGWPAGVSFWYYLWFHLWHHKYNGTEKDGESFDYSYHLMDARPRRTRLLGLLLHMSMAVHHLTALWRMALAVTGRLAGKLMRKTPELNEVYARRIQRDYRIIAGLLLSALLISVALNTTVLLQVWLIPLVIGWAPAHALIELPEHWKCDKPDGDVLVNTRTIRASRFARWYTNNNCNHVGHHMDMSVPLEKLPEFEKRLMREVEFKHLGRSYPAFYAKFLRFIWRGNS